jgi:ribosome-binding factor A
VTTDLSVATVHLSISSRKAGEILEAVKSNAKQSMIYHKEFVAIKVPNLVFFIDDSLDYIEKLTMC